MWRQMFPALRMTLVLTVLTGLFYPGIVTAITQAVFRKQANGSLLAKNGKVIGSELIRQNFSRPEYFQPRASAAGNGYDATSSGGSNLGPTSAKLIHGTTKMDDKKNEVVDYDGINLRIVHYCVDNNIPYESSLPLDGFKDASGALDDVKLIKAFNDDKAPLVFTPKATIPADAVTASASGLDPHISPGFAKGQAERVAKARGVDVIALEQLIAQYTEGRDWGFLGEPRVNVLRLNLALDQSYPMSK
jgi:potassium-transporting ATPase KdpC subunit